ncbi:MAG: PDZ domain-containing protein [Armatimonadetes bacterium]|nr:PDZ domain-containing protein [Armatimonadota bacterium]
MNLNVFDFDYDLTWMSFFTNANEHIYGRYGGRDTGDAEAHLSLAGLKQALRRALEAHRRDPDGKPSRASGPASTPEQYPAARRLKAGACIHCHQVNDFRREALKVAGNWRLENVWVYPPPENVGISLDRDQGDRVAAVAANSPAGRIGLRAGDRLQSLNGQPVASFADAQYALHRAPVGGAIPISWQRAGRTLKGDLSLADGWRKADISWRASMWGLDPSPGVHGQDLTAAEKKALGLPADHLAFRQGGWVTKQARAVGIREGDVITGIEGETLAMNVRQFNAYVRLNYQVGDRIVLQVIRGKERLSLPMVLPARVSF